MSRRDEKDKKGNFALVILFIFIKKTLVCSSVPYRNVDSYFQRIVGFKPKHKIRTYT